MFDGVGGSTILASAEAEECLGAQACYRPLADWWVRLVTVSLHTIAHRQHFRTFYNPHPQRIRLT